MRLRNIPGAREEIAASKYTIPAEPAPGVEVEIRSHKYGDKKSDEGGRMVLGDWAVKGHWHDVFGNSNPIHIEIGMGKGAFLMEHARREPDVNFVGIEKYSSVLLRAVQKQNEENLPNLRLVRMDAEYITDVFAPGEVAKIYLNFSDPWPKARTAKRRLTSQQFLARYDQILQSDGIVEFKTDNTDLFDFSLEEIEPAGWKLLAMTRDLHKDPDMREGNIMTEYETKFSALGQKICKYVIAR